MKVARPPDTEVVTYALGSCLGITIYDPLTHVGGMLHVMLPQSAVSLEKAKERPFMFIDSGLPHLFNQAYTLGARKERLVVVVAGGASLKAVGKDCFEIGKRNILILRKILLRNGVNLKAEEVGGNCSRNMSLDLTTGNVSISTYSGNRAGKEEKIYKCL